MRIVENFIYNFVCYSLIYSNQIELEKGIQEIKSLGEIKYSYINSAKILFGLPILEKGSS